MIGAVFFIGYMTGVLINTAVRIIMDESNRVDKSSE